MKMCRNMMLRGAEAIVEAGNKGNLPPPAAKTGEWRFTVPYRAEALPQVLRSPAAQPL